MRLFVLTTGLSMFCAAALAGQQVNETLDAASDGYVEIEHVNGKAVITGWDKDEVKVVGELSDRTERFIFERDGDEVLIKVKVERQRNGWNWNSDDGDDLEIFIPHGSRLNYTSVNADVTLSAIHGGTEVEVVNGDVEADDLQKKVQLESVNGDIDTTNLNGNIRIETVNGSIEDNNTSKRRITYETVNGNIDVTSNASEIKAETVNGNIDMVLDKVEDVSLSSVNGSVSSQMTLLDDGDVRVSTVGGGVSLYFQKGVSARFDIEGHAGGRIVNKLSDHKEQKAKYGPSRWLEFSLNGGDATVDVSTVSGRVKLDYQ